MNILDTRENLNAMVLNHEQQIKDIAAHLLELKQYMEFKRREWVGLTDEELLELSKDAWGRNKLHLGRSDHTGFYIDSGRAVEAKLKEKRE